MDWTHYWSLQTWLHFTPPIEATTSATCNNQGITQDSDAVLLCDKMSGDEDELSLHSLAILHFFKCALLIAAIHTWFFSWYLYREHTKLPAYFPPIWNNFINHTFTQSRAVYCKKKTPPPPTHKQKQHQQKNNKTPHNWKKKQVLVLSLNSLGQAFLQYILTCHRAEGKTNRIRHTSFQKLLRTSGSLHLQSTGQLQSLRVWLMELLQPTHIHSLKALTDVIWCRAWIYACMHIYLHTQLH